jgi:hypothetical protein
LHHIFKIDLVKGYHQIRGATADIPKTAIIMPFGLLEYLFTPFGLSNCAQTFKYMMDYTLDSLEGVFANHAAAIKSCPPPLMPSSSCKVFSAW